MSQKDTNPFLFSDTNKRYYTYEYYLRRTFGGRVAKLPVDGGFTCPNIDGSCGTGGCIYCSGRGSGDFAPPPTLSITDQLEAGRRAIASKWKTEKYIAYFQAFKAPALASDTNNKRIWVEKNNILRGTIYDRNLSPLTSGEKTDKQDTIICEVQSSEWIQPPEGMIK